MKKQKKSFWLITFPKEAAVEVTLMNGQKVKIAGIAKGSGMIAPNMGEVF